MDGERKLCGDGLSFGSQRFSCRASLASPPARPSAIQLFVRIELWVVVCGGWTQKST